MFAGTKLQHKLNNDMHVMCLFSLEYKSDLTH